LHETFIPCWGHLQVERFTNNPIKAFMKTQKTTLISEELKYEFFNVGTQEDVADPIIIAKFFNPSGAGTWYAIAYNEDKNICFGYVTSLGYDERGYFIINELESLSLPPFGLGIERDLYFKSCPLSEIAGKPS